MLKSLLSLAFLLILSTCGYSQDYKELIYWGNYSYEEGDYYAALDYYYDAWTLDSSNTDIAYKMAESARFTNDYVEAAHWYKFIIRSGLDHHYPESYYWLARMYMNNEKYDDAIKSIETYLDYGGSNKENTAAAERIKQSLMQIDRLFEDENKVTIEHLDKKINTPFSEFAATQIDDKYLYLSAYRAHNYSGNDDLIPNVFISEILQSKKSSRGYWLRPKPITANINKRNKHTANPSFSSDGKTLYFTYCSENRDQILQCQIFKIRKQGREWSKPQKLPKSINVSGKSVTHPCIVQEKDFEILYFSSDRKGGFGGFDLWYSVIKDDVYSAPVNLGSLINTEFHEITPFYDSLSSQLYFSSDRPEGLGGLDIFHVGGKLNSWETVSNIGYPINSGSNDLYFSLTNDTSGYFTSNRPGSYHLKGETCCSDIYAFTLLKEEIIPDPIIDQDTLENSEKARLLLPISLYFHNDIPDPGSRKPTTLINYKETLIDYYTLKAKYQREYSRGLKGIDVELAMEDIELFFDDYVNFGFEQLEMLTNHIRTDLEDGLNVEITVRGFSSPLNNEAYNLNLAKRRINSLENYLRSEGQGFYTKHLNPDAKVRLIIIEEPMGESASNPFVSDNPNDLRNSVYSKSAALERKIEIIKYRLF